MLGNKLDVLDFINEHGAISIEIAKNLFYNTKYGYDTARRVLKKMEQDKLLKSDKDFVTGKKIYFLKKKISSHKLMLLNFYSELVALGAEVVEFQKEYKAYNKISDGLIVYKYAGEMKIILIEIDINNKTKPKKYEELYKSNYYQNLIGTFPRVFVVDKDAESRARVWERGVCDDVVENVVCINYKMENLDKYL